MEELLNNLPVWITWVFSGIGVAVIGYIGNTILKRDDSLRQSQKAGNNSTQIQSGRDTYRK